MPQRDRPRPPLRLIWAGPTCLTWAISPQLAAWKCTFRSGYGSSVSLVAPSSTSNSSAELIIGSPVRLLAGQPRRNFSNEGLDVRMVVRRPSLQKVVNHRIAPFRLGTTGPQCQSVSVLPTTGVRTHTVIVNGSRRRVSVGGRYSTIHADKLDCSARNGSLRAELRAGGGCLLRDRLFTVAPLRRLLIRRRLGIADEECQNDGPNAEHRRNHECSLDPTVECRDLRLTFRSQCGSPAGHDRHQQRGSGRARHLLERAQNRAAV